jgi:inner membrane transporter RhtA
MLSSAIPYLAEMEALTRLPAGTFGVLLSMEPAFAALVGLIALDQSLISSEVTAIALIVLASAGALSTEPTVEAAEA